MNIFSKGLKSRLTYYYTHLSADFEGDKKTKEGRDPWESNNFLLGESTQLIGGGSQSYNTTRLKHLSVFYKQKIRIYIYTR